MNRLNFTKAFAIISVIALIGACSDDDENNISVNNSTSPNNTTPGDAGNNTTPGDAGNNTTPGDAGDDDTGETMGFDFRTEAPAEYTRVDALGQPAISTALIPSDQKAAYNDAIPNIGDFVTPAVGTLTAIHTALDDELTGLGLTPCTMMDTDGDTLPDCLGQDVTDGAGPLSPAGIVLPDTVKILDTTADLSGQIYYPNGRYLADPVIDIILSVILLDQSVHDPGTLVGAGLNPPMNDANNGEFAADFPYLNAPFTP